MASASHYSLVDDPQADPRADPRRDLRGLLAATADIQAALHHPGHQKELLRDPQSLKGLLVLLQGLSNFLDMALLVDRNAAVASAHTDSAQYKGSLFRANSAQNKGSLDRVMSAHNKGSLLSRAKLGDINHSDRLLAEDSLPVNIRPETQNTCNAHTDAHLLALNKSHSSDAPMADHLSDPAKEADLNLLSSQILMTILSFQTKSKRRRTTILSFQTKTQRWKTNIT